jgi:hypothetical protein
VIRRSVSLKVSGNCGTSGPRLTGSRPPG